MLEHILLEWSVLMGADSTALLDDLGLGIDAAWTIGGSETNGGFLSTALDEKKAHIELFVLHSLSSVFCKFSKLCEFLEFFDLQIRRVRRFFHNWDMAE